MNTVFPKPYYKLKLRSFHLFSVLTMHILGDKTMSRLDIPKKEITQQINRRELKSRKASNWTRNRFLCSNW